MRGEVAGSIGGLLKPIGLGSLIGIEKIAPMIDRHSTYIDPPNVRSLIGPHSNQSTEQGLNRFAKNPRVIVDVGG